MPRRLLLALLAASVLAAGCSKLERLTIVRPSAARGEYTKVAPTYDVSGKQASLRAADATQLLMSAADLYQQGDYVQARILAERALRAEPRSADAHALLGAIADASGDARRAGVHYGKAVEIAPKTVGNHISAIFLKLGVASRAEAIVQAREAGLGLGR